MNNDFNTEYLELLRKIWFSGIETAPRGMKVKELLGEKLKLISPENNLITIPQFKTNINYVTDELKWYLSGSNNINFTPLIKRSWERYSDDGIHVNSAYGYRIFGKHPDFINQWDWVKKKLSCDSDSRQAIININDVSDKCLENTKDFPCTIACQVFIRDNKLYWVTYMRSQDIFLGMRNDVYCFTELQKILAKELSIDCGNYIHFCGSLHLYEKNYERVFDFLKSVIV